MKTAMQEFVNDTLKGDIKSISYYLDKEMNDLIYMFNLGNDFGYKGKLPSGKGCYDKLFKNKKPANNAG